jgi:regulator of RNase E activity RraA
VNLRGPYKDGPGSINVTITVGGMQVNPGDIIVGDADGLVAVAPAQALEIARLSKEKVAHEQATIAEILNGTYSSAWVDAALKAKGI